MSSSRRDFLKRSSIGLAAVGALGTGGLVLQAGIEPTPADGSLDAHRHFLTSTPAPQRAADRWAVTPSDQKGPFYRAGAPYRGKVTPPMEPGDPLVITGRVWGHDTREPLPGAFLDVWQADLEGDYEDADGGIRLRARVLADEDGYFEYETVYPGNYDRRPAHVHHLVRAPGYSDLVTQLYFAGDRNNGNERLDSRLVIGLEEVRSRGGRFRRGVFDIVLAPAA